MALVSHVPEHAGPQISHVPAHAGPSSHSNGQNIDHNLKGTPTSTRCTNQAPNDYPTSEKPPSEPAAGNLNAVVQPVGPLPWPAHQGQIGINLEAAVPSAPPGRVQPTLQVPLLVGMNGQAKPDTAWRAWDPSSSSGSACGWVGSEVPFGLRPAPSVSGTCAAIGPDACLQKPPSSADTGGHDAGLAAAPQLLRSEVGQAPGQDHVWQHDPWQNPAGQGGMEKLDVAGKTPPRLGSGFDVWCDPELKPPADQTPQNLTSVAAMKAQAEQAIAHAIPDTPTEAFRFGKSGVNGSHSSWQVTTTSSTGARASNDAVRAPVNSPRWRGMKSVRTGPAQMRTLGAR